MLALCCSLSASKVASMSTFVPRIVTVSLILSCLVFAQEPKSQEPSNPAATPQGEAPAQTEPAQQPENNAPAKQEPEAPPAAQAPEKPSERPTAKPAPALNSREEAWQLLDDAYTGDKTSQRADAVRVLGLMPGDPKALKMAEKALDDEKPEVRVAAATALGEMKSKTSIPKLVKAMDDKDPTVALAAAHALDLMHDERAYDVYYEILTGERKSSEGLIASQTKMLKDPKKLAELGFSEGIGFIPFASIPWEAFKVIKKDDSSPVRVAAAKVLAKDPDPASTKALEKAAGDKSWLVRAAALESLSNRGDPRALDTVELYMSDDKDAVKYTAAAASLHLMAIRDAKPATKKKPAARRRSK
jgi:HEAT repeat protein